MSHDFQKYFSNHGIFNQTSCAYTSQQNGLAKGKNKCLLNIARSLMFASNFPNWFWGEATLTVTYPINHLAKSLKFHTPINLLKECFPHVHLLTSLPLNVFWAYYLCLPSFSHSSQVWFQRFKLFLCSISLHSKKQLRSKGTNLTQSRWRNSWQDRHPKFKTSCLLKEPKSVHKYCDNLWKYVVIIKHPSVLKKISYIMIEWNIWT